jgi:hypothetical protein
MNKPLNLNTVKRLKTKQYHFVSTKRLKEFTATEVQMLIAHRQYQQQIEQLNRVTAAAKAELAANNKFHPELRYTESMEIPQTMSSHDILNLRVSSPIITWDDTNRLGQVKMFFKGRTGIEQLTYMYAFSDALLNSAKDFDNLIGNSSLEITQVLVTEITKHFKPPEPIYPLLYKPKEPEYNEDPE